MDVKQFFTSQLQAWPMAANNFADLRGVKTKEAGWAKAQFNPARMVSTGAKMDKATLDKRPCFLCAANRPKEQTSLPWGEYEILVNPFPIFPDHLTIPALEHTPQSIIGRVADMCRLAESLPGYAVFYNGPKCGASAPDHMHFQAGNAAMLPILTSQPPFGVIRLSATSPQGMEAQFANVYSMLPKAAGEEAMMNVLCQAKDGEYHLVIIPRKRHRPSFYGSEPGQMVISPASVDLGGLIITPRAEDFDSITEADASRVFSEVCYTQSEVDAMLHPTGGRTISVGIITTPSINLVLEGDYEKVSDGKRDPAQKCQTLRAEDVKSEILFRSLGANSRATVKDVVIGVNFHWERKEDQSFVGDIRIVPTDDGLTLINVVPVERYLASVISSEMSATSQPELLKAHAVISRSWVLSQIVNKYIKRRDAAQHCTATDTDTEVVKWYDHDDHTLFDVCADDHCQRYQGVTRQTTEAVEEAIAATEAEVLMYGGELCDARFSKCCGGAFEVFENCWEPEPKPYLQGLADAPDRRIPDLTVEENARQWILSAPEAFCNTRDGDVLRQVLNGYDQETADFYRWRVSYDAEELGKLIKEKSGYDFGSILNMEPLQRGTSGRIVRLRIVGEKLTLIVGKELEIRRWLSPSHLYSSAFVVEKTQSGFTLHGAGWGHGVGLCQIGAAMMAAKGYSYRQILSHYFPGAVISKF